MFIVPFPPKKTSPLGSGVATSKRRKIFTPSRGYKHLVPTGRFLNSMVSAVFRLPAASCRLPSNL